MRRFETHIMAFTEAEGNITNQDIRSIFEKAMEGSVLTPELMQIGSNDGHNDVVIFIDGERVSLQVVTDIYRNAALYQEDHAKQGARQARLEEAEATVKALRKYINSIQPRHEGHLMTIKAGMLSILDNPVTGPSEAPAEGQS